MRHIDLFKIADDVFIVRKKQLLQRGQDSIGSFCQPIHYLLNLSLYSELFLE